MKHKITTKQPNIISTNDTHNYHLQQRLSVCDFNIKRRDLLEMWDFYTSNLSKFNSVKLLYNFSMNSHINNWTSWTGNH